MYSLNLFLPVNSHSVALFWCIRYLESKPQHWRPGHSVQVKEIENVNKMRMALYANHTINFQNSGDRGNRRSDLVLELKKCFEDLGIKYHLLPQQVHLSYVGTAASVAPTLARWWSLFFVPNFFTLFSFSASLLVPEIWISVDLVVAGVFEAGIFFAIFGGSKNNSICHVFSSCRDSERNVIFALLLFYLSLEAVIFNILFHIFVFFSISASCFPSSFWLFSFCLVWSLLGSEA